MKLCDQCDRLRLAPARNDVPIHLSASDPPIGEGPATFKARVFECDVCDSRWGWKDILGWYLETPHWPASAPESEPSASG